MAVVVVIAMAVVSSLAPRDAEAHAFGLSRGSYVVRRGVDNVRVEATLVFAASDAPLLTAGEEIATVSADDVECTPDADEAGNAGRAAGATVDSDESDALRVRLAWTCPEAPRVILALPFLARAEAMGAPHRHIASFSSPGPMEELLFAGHDHLSIDVPPEIAANASASAAPRSFLRFLVLGIRHVLSGADHVAFVLGLVLCGGRFRHLAKLVTAFTVAHSATLALATFGLVTPSARLVEPLVALSVAFVGVDSFLHQRRARALSVTGVAGVTGADPRGARWPVAFAFGLVHGLAFADSLRSLDLHGGAMARALVGFNTGVEVAQIAVLVVAVPVIHRLRRSDRAAPVLLAASVAIAIAGVTWFVLRLV